MDNGNTYEYSFHAGKRTISEMDILTFPPEFPHETAPWGRAGALGP